MTWAALLGLVVAWAATEPAVPPPPTPASWELEWAAPPTCPSAAAIREQVAALVPEASRGEGVLYVHATIEPRDEGFVLSLRTDFAGRHDEREVRARACSELAEAVTLVVAFSLDPALAVTKPPVFEPSTTVPDVPEPEAGPPPSPQPPSLAPRATPVAAGLAATPLEPSLRGDAPPESRPSRLPSAWMLRLAPKLEVGTLPALGGGLELAVGMLWRWWRLELHGSHSWPRRAPGPGESAGRFQLGAIGVRGCGRPRVGRVVELPVCLGLQGGALRVDSEGLRPATTVHGPWLVQSLGVGLAAGGTRVGFWTLLEGSATLVWSRVLVGEETVFRPFPVSARWLAGVEIAFAIESR